MQSADEPKLQETAPAASANPPAELRVAPPALDASQQPGFKVVEEVPRAASSKLVWTALIVAVAIIVAYVLGWFR